MSIFRKDDTIKESEEFIENSQPAEDENEAIDQTEADTQADEIGGEIVSSYADETAIIAEDTRILGSIKTKGHIAIAGIVDGDVIAAGNIMLIGVVKGKIECNNIILDGCKIATSVKAAGSVSVKENSSIIGNIICKHISVMGTVAGDIKAEGNVGLSKTSVTKGNIIAKVLAVEPGAKIQGNILVR